MEEKDSVFVQDDNAYNKKTKAVPKPKRDIGIDTDNVVLTNIVQDLGSESGVKTQHFDMTEIESFTQVSQSRDMLYTLLDTMGDDTMVSAVLETYAEDITESNAEGKTVWCESNDTQILTLVNYLLDTLNIEKNIYSWAYSLCKYGDLYIKLFRQSEVDKLNNLFVTTDTKQQLKEDVKIKAYSQDDHYAHYIEAVPNPAEVFELMKFGKTYAYIKADINSLNANKTNENNQYTYRYNFKKQDVFIEQPTSYVHAALEDNSSRTPEMVTVFDSTDNNERELGTFRVRRGQSLLYNEFKVWRELSLMENSILLNRITKSAVLRIIGVEVGSMPKEQVGPHLQGIKNLMEQKMSLDTNSGMTEYTNPGPVENNVYIPTHNQVGNITVNTVGGDVQVGQLTDLDYFKDKFYGGLRVPKQYFGQTGDSAGFDAGKSLAIISARYSKMAKRIQKTLIQMITDIINIFLLDKDLSSYIGKFKLHMQPPNSIEENERRENESNKIRNAQDIMNLLTDIQDATTKVKVLKELLSNVTVNAEIIQLIQDEIDKLENEEQNVNNDNDNNNDNIDNQGGNMGGGSSVDDFNLGSLENETPIEQEIDDIGTEGENTETPVEEPTSSEETILPNGEDLGVNLVDNK